VLLLSWLTACIRELSRRRNHLLLQMHQLLRERDSATALFLGEELSVKDRQDFLERFDLRKQYVNAAILLQGLA
jgi:hypothetical protein